MRRLLFDTQTGTDICPIVAYPGFDRDFILDTDASEASVGAVLSQKDDAGTERVIAYGSRSLTKAQRGYTVTRRELLSRLLAKYFRHYMYGRRFVVRTDYRALQWLRSFKEPEG
jgi:hypothetical protein